MRKWLVIILLLGLAIYGLWSWREALHPSSPAGVSANYAEVVKGDIEAVVTAQGKLEPKEYVDVGAQVSGLVKKLHADIGSVVKSGDLIAEIDPDVYESRVAGNQARLKTLQAQKTEQQAQVRQARQKLARNRKLIENRAISQEALEDTQTALDIANAQIASLEAQIEEVTSLLEGDRANLGYTKIYAPMDGTVVSQSTKEGQTINASQTAPVIVQIANLDIMTVRAQVAEADIGKLRQDMPAYFTTLGSQNRRWEGKIRQILPSPETVNDVVLYNVLVDVGNTDRQLMTGMTTQVFFVLGSAKNALTIPASALIKRLPEADTAQGAGYQVRTLASGKAEPVSVVIGLTARTQAEVISGLNEGDKVLLQTPTSKPQDSGAQRRMPGGMGRL